MQACWLRPPLRPGVMATASALAIGLMAAAQVHDIYIYIYNICSYTQERVRGVEIAVKALVSGQALLLGMAPQKEKEKKEKKKNVRKESRLRTRRFRARSLLSRRRSPRPRSPRKKNRRKGDRRKKGGRPLLRRRVLQHGQGRQSSRPAQEGSGRASPAEARRAG